MNERVMQVEQYPLAAILTFDARRSVTRRFDDIRNVIHQRGDVTAGRAARDDHPVGYSRHVTHIELDDIDSLHVLESRDDDIAQFLAIHSVHSYICLSPQ